MKGEQELGRAVAARRVQLGMRTAKQLAERSGLSTRLISDVESGRRDSYAKASLEALNRALEWPPGAAEHILQTGVRPGQKLHENNSANRNSGHVERWRTIEHNGEHFLEVSAGYDPEEVDAENLERIALSARHYIQQELRSLSEEPLLEALKAYLEDMQAGNRRSLAFPTPMPEEQEKAAFDPYAREDYKYGDEDEQTQVDP